jgi:Alpha-galactosyl-binding fungal lectin
MACRESSASAVAISNSFFITRTNALCTFAVLIIIIGPGLEAEGFPPDKCLFEENEDFPGGYELFGAASGNYLGGTDLDWLELRVYSTKDGDPCGTEIGKKTQHPYCYIADQASTISGVKWVPTYRTGVALVLWDSKNCNGDIDDQQYFWDVPPGVCASVPNSNSARGFDLFEGASRLGGDRLELRAYTESDGNPCGSQIRTTQPDLDCLPAPPAKITGAAWFELPSNNDEGDSSLKCHGVGGDTWMLSRDKAVSAAEEFCSQDVKDQEYFQDSADSVKLSAHHPDDSITLSSIKDCLGSFTLIIDSCDGDDPANNPHNYKFGGTYTSSDRLVTKKINILTRSIAYMYRHHYDFIKYFCIMYMKSIFSCESV